MNKQAILTFFKPSIWTAIILGIFIPVALLGHIQTMQIAEQEEAKTQHPIAAT